MRLKDLTEGLSNILYHSTDFPQGANIIKNNQFILRLNSPDEVHIPAPSKKYYYMSASRNSHNDFAQSLNYPITFTLDGEKLSQRYKGRPAVFAHMGGRGYQTEFEDRIFNDSPIIPNAKKYILEVHILLIDYDNESYDDLEKETIRKYIRRQFNYIGFIEDNIDRPVYIYDDIDDYLFQRKSRSIRSLDSLIYSFDKNFDYDEKSIISSLKTNSSTHDRDIKSNKYPSENLKIWAELILRNDINELSPDAIKLLQNMEAVIMPSTPKKWADSLKYEIENFEKRPFATVKFTNIMKKYKLNTYIDVINYIYKKWLSSGKIIK